MKQAVSDETDEVKWHWTFKFSLYLLYGEVFLGKMPVMKNCTSTQHLAHLCSPVSTLSLGLRSIDTQAVSGKFCWGFFFLIYVPGPSKRTGISERFCIKYKPEPISLSNSSALFSSTEQNTQ